MVIEPVKSDEVILIVDDVELNRAILSELFQKEYSILEAENGAEALELLEQNGGRIKVMLLDLVMPKMDGFKACRQIREVTNAPILIFDCKDHGPGQSAWIFQRRR